MSSALDKADLYHDLSGLNALRAHKDGPEALQAACRQFESFFTRQLLKTMREANEALDDDSLLDSQGSDFFREMYDDQLSVQLAKSGGMGLADLMYRQLAGKAEAAPVQPPAKPAAPTMPLRPVAASQAKLDLAKLAPMAAPDYPPLGSLLHADAAPALPAKAPGAPAAATPVAAAGDDWQSLATQAFSDFAVAPTPLAFVRTVWPFAKKAAETLGVSARVLIAQAALETGWGKSLLAKGKDGGSQSLFNIKADPSWDGRKTSVHTLEFEQGVPVRRRAQFRAYESLYDSFEDYVRLITDSPRYREAVRAGGDALAYVKALQEAGYATDPAYADKISRVYHSPTLVEALRALKF